MKHKNLMTANRYLLPAANRLSFRHESQAHFGVGQTPFF